MLLRDISFSSEDKKEKKRKTAGEQRSRSLPVALPNAYEVS
jgi:hypothetical protein